MPMVDGGVQAEAAATETRVLDRIRPDVETLARVKLVCEHLVARAKEVADQLHFPIARCLVAGSAARGTFLKDRLDLDFFFLFPPTVSRAELERMGLELGSTLLEVSETRYAEHPYRRGRFEGFTVDAVPGYAIEDPSHPMTAVDRTPFHQEYLVRRLTPTTVDQVLLTKQFLRSLGVYGSEARRGGFSGYLVELLVLRFGSLRALLDHAREWRIPMDFRSTPAAAPRVPDDVAFVLDDPVDVNRNVATALTRRNLALFILAARRYLDHPSEASFEPAPTMEIRLPEALERIRARGTHVCALTLPRPTLVDDILYPQLRKAERALEEEARRLGFSPLRTASAAGETEILVLLEVEHGELPAVRVHEGPPVGVGRAEEFVEKWGGPTARVFQGPYVTPDGHLAVEVRRTERSIEPVLTATLSHLPIGRDLRSLVTPAVSMQALAALGESPALVEALSDLLGQRLPWLPRVP